MSEDKQVMDMVNDHAAKAQSQCRKDTPSVTAQGRASSPKGGAEGGEAAVRAFLLMAVRVLLWVLAGAVILALRVSGQIAVWLTASCRKIPA